MNAWGISRLAATRLMTARAELYHDDDDDEERDDKYDDDDAGVG